MFSYPSVYIDNDLTIVISPLSALIEDQINSLKEKNIHAIKINKKNVEYIKKGLYSIVYTSPEFFISEKELFFQIGLFDFLYIYMSKMGVNAPVPTLVKDKPAKKAPKRAIRVAVESVEPRPKRQ